MKNQILLLLLLCSGSLSSQRLIDPPYDLSHFNTSAYVRQIDTTNTLGKDTIIYRTVSMNYNWSDTSLFIEKQNFFLIGFQWGGGINYAVEDRLYTNARQNGFSTTNPYESGTGLLTPYKRTIHAIYQPYWEDSIAAPCVDWYPATNVWHAGTVYAPVPGDKSGAINGFATKSGGRSIQDSTSSNFLRYVLVPDSVHTLAGDTSRVVLSKPVLFPDHAAKDFPMRLGEKVFAKNETSASSLDTAKHNGTRWYLNINLRRLNGDTTSLDTNQVLSIKVKWWRHYFVLGTLYSATGFIAFDSVYTYTSTTDTIHTSRGVASRSLHTPSSVDTTSFIIRRNALPLYSAPDSLRDISLCAYFRTAEVNDDRAQYKSPNPLFQSIYNPANENIIDSIDIIVTYHGNCPISISRISLLTPQAKEILFGYHDRNMAEWAYSCLDDIRVRQNNDTNAAKYLRFFRWYGVDETPECLWRIHRYVSKLTKGRFVTEGVGSAAYRHLVGPENTWTGGEPSSCFKQDSPSLYRMLAVAANNSDAEKKRVDSLNRRIGMDYSNGWKVSNNVNKYECLNCSKSGFGINPSTPSFIEDGNFLKWNTSYALCALEESANHAYLNQRRLYDEQPWWFNSFIAGRYSFKLDSGSSPSIPDTANLYLGRPRIGEELRREFYMNLLLGAKGVFYDRLYSADGYRHDSTALDTTKLHYASMTMPFSVDTLRKYHDYREFSDFSGALFAIGKTYRLATDTTGEKTLLDNASGSDYVPTSSTALCRIWDYVKKPQTWQFLHVDSSKLYLGYRSTRYEMMKFHDFIKANESTIMQMRLAAWSGKGFNWFRTAKNQDTTLYHKFIDMGWNGLKSKKIGASTSEPWNADSTFIDATVHTLDSISMDSTFVIGVLNRHSNCLVDEHPLLPDSLRYIFHPSFEFDSLVKVGSLSKYSQLGSREITIPLSYQPPMYDKQGRLLHVQELTTDSSTAHIDTVLCTNCSFSAKFQPGEGKFFKVTVMKPKDASAAKGSLDYANQRKIIAMPVLIGKNTSSHVGIYDSSRVRYHMVYTREDTTIILGTPPTTVLTQRVYYKRSKIINACTPQDMNPLDINTTNLWDTTMCISNDVHE